MEAKIAFEVVSLACKSANIRLKISYALLSLLRNKFSKMSLVKSLAMSYIIK